MDTFQAVTERRAIKHYDPAFKMPEKDLQQLLDLVIQSPTSFNIQNWRFVLVEDKKLRQEIKQAAWGQEQITDASLLFVLTADLKAWDNSPERYWQNAPKDVSEMLVGMIRPFYEGKPQLQRDEAMRSIGIAAQTLMLVAKALGYDSCPMIGFDSEKVAELIKLPDEHVVGMIVVVGKATKKAWPKPGQLPVEEVVIRNHF